MQRIQQVCIDWPDRREYEDAHYLVLTSGREAAARAIDEIRERWQRTLDEHPVLRRMLDQDWSQPPVSWQEAEPYVRSALEASALADGLDWSEQAAEVVDRAQSWWPDQVRLLGLLLKAEDELQTYREVVAAARDSLCECQGHLEPERYKALLWGLGMLLGDVK